MALKIEIANIYEEKTDLELRNLIKAAFQSNKLLSPGYLAANIQSNASKASFFLVAKENEKIIGCNAFLANDFTLNNSHYVGYQSCWSAIHPEHQGKGIFVAIINEAKRILKDDGAGFLYGIPNDNSLPIFTKKLSFTETPSIVKRIFNTPFFRQLNLNPKNIDTANVCAINEQQVKAHKSIQFPSEVKTFGHNNSWVWGKLLHKKKLGIKIPVFYVGGFYIKEEKDLKKLLSKIFRAHNVLFIQVLSNKTHNLTPLIKGWKNPKMNSFIFYNLNIPEFIHFNVMIGAIDIF